MKLNLEQYLRELEWLVNTDSGQGNPEGITAVGDFFADRFGALGWIVEKYDLRPNTANSFTAQERCFVRGHNASHIDFQNCDFSAEEMPEKSYILENCDDFRL